MKLAAVRKLAMSLPDVTEEPHFDMTSFRVRGKIFVTAPPDGAHLHVFVDDALRGPAVAAHPEFIEPLLWGGKVCGLRIALAAAKPGAVENLVQAAWERRSQKKDLSRRALRSPRKNKKKSKRKKQSA